VALGTIGPGSAELRRGTVGAKMPDTSCSALGASVKDSLRTLDDGREVKMEKQKFHL